MLWSMDLTFLFRRPGNTVTSVAKAAGVNPSTASRWKDGATKADWIYVCRLYAQGILTNEDLRAAGLSIPVQSDPPAAA